MKIKTVSCRLEVKVQPAPFSSLGASWSIEFEPPKDITALPETAQLVRDAVSERVEDQLIEETAKFFGEEAAGKVRRELKKYHERNK